MAVSFEENSAESTTMSTPRTNVFSDRLSLVVASLGVLCLLVASCDTLSSGNGGDSGPLLPRGVYAVDADASGDATGASWDDAFTNLQVALDSAEAGDEVWVASGTYVPSEARDPGDERTASFVIPAGVEVYGGFSGDETRRQERGSDPSRTILSGDRGVENESSDNSYHVVVTSGADAETMIQDVTIEAGHANGEEQPRSIGGGLYNEQGQLTVRDVMFRNNQAVDGGGIFDSTGTIKLKRVVFTGNQASASGGGVFIDEKAELDATDLQFRSNEAKVGGGMVNQGRARLNNVLFEENAVTGPVEPGLEGGGGGLVNSFGPLTLRDAQFLSNEAEDSGGGMLLLASLEKSDSRISKGKLPRRKARPSGRAGGIPTSPVQETEHSSTETERFGNEQEGREGRAKASVVPSIEEVRFEDNGAAYGGGVYNQYADAVFENVTFTNNRVDSTGGGVYNRFNGATYRNVRFRKNEAGNFGGGIYNESATGTIVDARFIGNQAGRYAGGADNLLGDVTYANVLFYDNEALREQGGALSGLQSNYSLHGVTVARNRAENGGDAMHTVLGQPTVVNSVFWENGNAPTEEVVSIASKPVFRHSLIRGSGGSENWNSNYGTDDGGNLDQPPEFTSMSADGLRLTAGSQAIDAGTEEPEIQRYDVTDLGENDRIVDGDGDGNTIIDMGAYEYQP